MLRTNDRRTPAVDAETRCRRRREELLALLVCATSISRKLAVVAANTNTSVLRGDSDGTRRAHRERSLLEARRALDCSAVSARAINECSDGEVKAVAVAVPTTLRRAPWCPPSASLIQRDGDAAQMRRSTPFLSSISSSTVPARSPRIHRCAPPCRVAGILASLFAAEQHAHVVRRNETTSGISLRVLVRAAARSPRGRSPPP